MTHAVESNPAETAMRVSIQVMGGRNGPSRVAMKGIAGEVAPSRRAPAVQLCYPRAR